MDDIEKMLTDEGDEDLTNKSSEEKDENEEEKVDFESLAQEKARLELELEKAKKNEIELRRQRDRYATEASKKKVEADEDDEYDEDTRKRDEKVVFNKLGAVKKEDLDNELQKIEDRLSIRMRTERLATELREGVVSIVKDYPFVKANKIESYLNENPRSSVTQAAWAVYGKEMSEYDLDHKSAFPIADRSEMDFEELKPTKDVPLGDKRKMNNLIARMISRGE